MLNFGALRASSTKPQECYGIRWRWVKSESWGRTWHEDGGTVDGNDRSDGHPVLAGTPSQGEEGGTIESDQPHTFARLQPNECQVQSDGCRRRQTDRLWDELRDLGSEPQGRDDQEQDPLD